MREVIALFSSALIIGIIAAAVGVSCNKQGPYGTTDHSDSPPLDEIHRQHAICYYFKGHPDSLTCIERFEDYE